MLNLIRQKKEQLKWVLWLVIVALGAGMVLLFVATPSGRGGQGEKEMGNYIARVDDAEISVSAFRSNLLTMLNLMGPEARRDPNTMRQYGQYALMSMVRSVLLSQEAARYGFTVTDEEVMDNIVSSPAFNINGDFIGTEEYKARLKRLGTTPEEYELEIRRSLLSRKLNDFITSSATVTDDEIRTAFVDKNNRAKIRYAIVYHNSFAGKVNPTPADLQQYYDAHKTSYRVDETRQIKYILFGTKKLATTLVGSVTDQEMRAEYDANKDKRYQETVQAAHILIKVPEGASETVVAQLREKAVGIVAEARRPDANFAELAKKYSEDPGSANAGGNVGSFARGKMVNEFENAAFAMKVGEISDPVRTQFGFHIIKVNGHRDFDHYRSILARNIAFKRAQDQLKGVAETALKKAGETKNLDPIAKELGGTIEISKPFNTANPDYSLGNPKDMTEDIFSLELNQIGKLHESFNGYIIPQLIKILPAHVPALEEVKQKVEQDFRTAEAARLAKEEAQRVLAEIGKEKDFEKAAKKFNLTVETSDQFGLADKISEQLGQAPAVAADVLGREKDACGDVGNENLQIVYQVLERVKPDFGQFPAQKEELRSTLRSEKERTLFEAMVSGLLQQYTKDNKIEINQVLLDRILG